MDQRPMSATFLFRVVAPLPALLAAATMALGAAAPAHAAAKPWPTVTGITPMQARIGDTLTIEGANFRRGAWRNTVVFKREKAVAVFVKARRATSTRLQVRIPNKLLPYLRADAAGPVASRFRIRILASRFGRRYTALADSPTIAPATRAVPGSGVVVPIAPSAPGTPSAPATPQPQVAPSDCDKDATPDATDADDDNDHLSDAIEAAIKTDPCDADTDGDSAEDGYEYVSALDLNDRALPFPGRRAFPNPLDPGDIDVDHDGDSLTLFEEHAAWKRYGAKSLDLNLSAGTQTTKPVPAASHRGLPLDFDRDGTVDALETAYLDYDGDGVLADDEQDIDKDGLSNYDETHGRLTRALIDGLYEPTAAESVVFPLEFAPVDWLDPDTDGDKVLDGNDDQDHDDVSNLLELSRKLAGGLLTPVPVTAWVQPFNPCLPNPDSRTCPQYVPLDGAWAPFGADQAFEIRH